MIKQITTGLSILALMMLPVATGETPETSEKIDVEIVKIECVQRKWSVFEQSSSGTGVRHGNLTITAAHVLKQCPDQTGIRYILDHDLALKYDGVPGDYELGCDAPVVGEDIVYTGYPNGRRIESDYGTVTTAGDMIIRVDEGGGSINIFTGIALGTSTKVRPGYSGGLVTTTDGQFRGIISSVNRATQDALFIPADLICNYVQYEGKTSEE